mmetsp:Transcript_32798/g.56139  ORF Transcript_32798/g.56139 Transcript_32798/m.56139 type:complete len:323 (-) Transcript_32798:62-1030(-)
MCITRRTLQQIHVTLAFDTRACHVGGDGEGTTDARGRIVDGLMVKRSPQWTNNDVEYWLEQMRPSDSLEAIVLPCRTRPRSYKPKAGSAASAAASAAAAADDSTADDVWTGYNCGHDIANESICDPTPGGTAHGRSNGNGPGAVLGQAPARAADGEEHLFSSVHSSPGAQWLVLVTIINGRTSATIWCARTRLPLQFRCSLDCGGHGPSPHLLNLSAGPSTVAAALEVEGKKPTRIVATLTAGELAPSTVGASPLSSSSASGSIAIGGGRKRRQKHTSKSGSSRSGGADAAGGAGGSGASGGAGGRARGRKGKGSKSGGKPR